MSIVVLITYVEDYQFANYLVNQLSDFTPIVIGVNIHRYNSGELLEDLKRVTTRFSKEDIIVYVGCQVVINHKDVIDDIYNQLDILDVQYIGKVGSHVTKSIVCDVSQRLNINIPKTWKSIEMIDSYPVIVKPDNSGGSIGIRVIKNPELLESLSLSDCVFQEYISGIELSCGIIGDHIAICEIQFNGEILSSDDKSNHRYKCVKHKLTTEQVEYISRCTKSLMYDLGIEIYSRSDWRLRDGQLYCLEINTHPNLATNGMFSQLFKVDKNISSLVPLIIQSYIQNKVDN